MKLTGSNWIGYRESNEGRVSIRAVNPATGETLEPAFAEAAPGEIARAAEAAAEAFAAYSALPAETRADFLDSAAGAIDALGDALTERAAAETGLDAARLAGERARTVNQMRLFAAVIREGSWVQARIDRAIPERAPLPKPDLRMMLSALGPVAVFGAANFPLAFSAGGGDTASALAAGCPVVVKAHPAHPGTCEMVARAILQAARAAGMPDGVYSLIHGASPETGLALARHPAIRAVAFTGSLKAGRALFDAAAARPEPIPVFAEMGSVNPVFLLPRALAERPEAIAQGLCASATLGGGQFCTKPGLIFGIRGESFVRFVQALGAAMAAAPPATMLHHGIAQAYAAGIERLRRTPGVRAIAEGAQPGASKGAHGRAAVFATDIGAYKANPSLAEEVFGPCALAVEGACGGCLRGAMEGLSGQLTISFHAAGDDLAEYADLLATARTKAGRLIVNGYPTGVEVCPSMAHGGPYPASTDSRFTSVGSAAIARFARPVCFQNFPQEALPAELRNINTRGIWRLVDNMLIRGNL